jgi:hypothetical protein
VKFCQTISGAGSGGNWRFSFILAAARHSA